ncbi:type 2 periplasmic-binding domain-containing protein [Pseudooceanicola spongiae]|uniref:Tricarboxylate transporter n=1 Tax=Pseudooceanicola spongiae TaxID=2613965 RepID=A0A7L9WQE4_9RHOB|nr:tricarboxylate transporter [Pseudooceanicola spongiae]QOL82479.1 tricarboxylate transporter [Pseudooceanicola spongiae]
MKLTKLLLAGVGAIGLALPVAAQDLGLSRINVTVPFGEGGGSDTLVRAIAPFLQPALTGEPTILIRNEPGGGGIPSTNRFVKNAARDGSDLISLSSSIFVASALSNPQIHFKLDGFIPVFVAPLGGVTYISPSTGATEPGDVAGIGDTTVIYGGGRQDSSDALTVMQFDLLGINVQSIWGVERGGSRIGFERGEFTVDQQTSLAFNSSVQPLVDAGTAIPFMTSGLRTADGEVLRDPIYPDLPTFLEVYEKVHGAPLSGPAYRAYTALSVAALTAGKTIALPKDTPQTVVDAYTAAFDTVIANPEFKDATKASLGGYPLLTGDAAQAAFANGGEMDDEAFAWLQDWYRTKLNFDLKR